MYHPRLKENVTSETRESQTRRVETVRPVITECPGGYTLLPTSPQETHCHQFLHFKTETTKGHPLKCIDGRRTCPNLLNICTPRVILVTDRVSFTSYLRITNDNNNGPSELLPSTIVCPLDGRYPAVAQVVPVHQTDVKLWDPLVPVVIPTTTVFG